MQVCGVRTAPHRCRTSHAGTGNSVPCPGSMKVCTSAGLQSLGKPFRAALGSRLPVTVCWAQSWVKAPDQPSWLKQVEHWCICGFTFRGGCLLWVCRRSVHRNAEPALASEMQPSCLQVRMLHSAGVRWLAWQCYTSDVELAALIADLSMQMALIHPWQQRVCLAARCLLSCTM